MKRAETMTPDEWLKALAVETGVRFPGHGFVFLCAPLDANVITCTSAGCNMDQARTLCDLYADGKEEVLAQGSVSEAMNCRWTRDLGTEIGSLRGTT
jgi:hypothetical protein